jgi:hypothetical protein
MSTSDSAITLHMFIRPGTPAGASETVVRQLAELYEFGLIGPGSEVWVNIEIPGVLWILSDRSSYLHIADVPTAGWVRLSGKTASWGSRRMNIAKAPGYVFSTENMPMPVHPNDSVTVALRNTDATAMRAVHSGAVHEMDDFEITYRSMRAVDFKLGGFMRKEPLKPPSEFDAHYAAVRGLDLLAALDGNAVHRVIRENLDAFTTTIDIDRFDRIRAVHQRMDQVSEAIIEPVVERIKALPQIGMFQGYDDVNIEDTDDEDEDTGDEAGDDDGEDADS